jgi:hypothetical protein
MAKDKKLFSKILLILLMIMIAAGFTIPMLDFEDQVYAVEPRICQLDSDCYLVCEDSPLKVLCSQNMCAQNDCNENPYYPFYDESVEFSFKVIDSSEVLLLSYDDIFINFNTEKVKFFSRGMSLNHLYERIGLNDLNYLLYINGEERFVGADYVPEQGDEILLDYSDN